MPHLGEMNPLIEGEKITYQVFWGIDESVQKDKPFSFENAAGCVLNDSGYIFGGRGNNLFNHIYKCNLKKLKWKRLKPSTTPKGRYGHTCNAYNKGLIIFGGARFFNHIR